MVTGIFQKDHQHLLLSNHALLKQSEYSGNIPGILPAGWAENVRRKLLNSSFLNSKFYIKSFSVAKTRDNKPYTIPCLIEKTPNIAVIGTNDINYKNL